ncbi:MAG: dihydrofolate synthase [Bacteroidetes bacterium]|nr:MAG: dihydrofolate synthase [Bacteroidota bacterium]
MTVQPNSYQQVLDYLYAALPMYQRQGKAAYKANLDNSLRLDACLNHPHRRFKSLHVAGTNGKGSVSHMLASVLQEAGYRTGLYTSPHLLDFRERIKINGRCIEKTAVISFVREHHLLLEDIQPSFFEMTVAMAFDYFAREEVDVAVIETGLGGRLDSTNIIRPELSIITNISMDHMAFLGDHPAAIAREKAGIIKENTPVVCGPTSDETARIIAKEAQRRKSSLIKAGDLRSFRFVTTGMDDLHHFHFCERKKQLAETHSCDLGGLYQSENLSTALATIDQLQREGWQIDTGHVASGLAAVVKNTGLMGRWQCLGHNPRSLCDTAHNAAGVAQVMKQLLNLPFKNLHLVWGMVDDKDVEGLLRLLPPQARFYFTQASLPRAMDAEALSRIADAQGLKGQCIPGVAAAYHRAQQAATPDDLIFTGGSTFVVADLLMALGYK